MVKWTEDAYLKEAKERLGILMVLAEDNPADKAAKEANKLDQHVSKVEMAIKLIKQDASDWIYWQDKDRNEKLVSIARPLNAAPFVKPLLFDAATIKVYMSAYLGEKKTFCRSVGIDPEEMAWATFGSTFPVENRKIVLGLIGPMSMRKIDTTMPSFLRCVDRIIRRYHDTKGIIHGNSYKICQAIYDHFKATDQGPRFLFPTNADERDDKFKEHVNSTEPTIMLSPSMTEGFDFANDLARWQIIAKIPWPSLSDKQVSAKKDQDPDWYSLEAIKTIIQACGRPVRSDTDHAVTFILDSDFNWVWEKYQSFFPRWFTSAFVWPPS
jgi:Rad3-related DNA helicase